MKLRRLFLVLSFFACALTSLAQEKNDVIQQRIEFISEQLEDESPDLTNLFDQLFYFYDHPINLNNTNIDELNDLGLLTDLQINDLLHHYGPYEISEFNSCQKQEQSLKYVCYMMALDGLPTTKQGYFRLLETNKRVILPTNTHLRLLVSAADVLHSWTVPSFGLKVDACPGRLNQANLFIKRLGIFFGQCSEICGVNHGFMPIVIVSLPTIQFHHYIMTKLELN